MARKQPPADAKCQEASIHSRETFIACGKPAVAIVSFDREGPYNMCASRAEHNVRRRGAYYVEEENDNANSWS